MHSSPERHRTLDSTMLSNAMTWIFSGIVNASDTVKEPYFSRLKVALQIDTLLLLTGNLR